MDGIMKQQGFTLVELIVVCAIIAILASSISSSFGFLIEQVRVQKDVSRLLLMIQTTRQYSINHATTTVLCPTNDNINCVRNWKLPLILFLDNNRNKKRDEDEAIIISFDAFSDDDIFISYPKSQIRFNDSGMAGFYNGTLRYCLNQSIKGIVISRTGRIRFAQDLNGDHIPDVNRNTPISCS
jgi:type IV fimbrial biogenesis protein FimT